MSNNINYELTGSSKLIYGDSLKAKTSGSAGLDLYITEDAIITPNQPELVPTGLKVSIPSGYFGMVCVRSSLGLKGLGLANQVGIIDSDYRGEILLALQSQTGQVMALQKGERVAQLIVVSHLPVEYVEVDSLEETLRGSGGFGSTGTT